MRKPGLQKQQTLSQQEITDLRRKAGKWVRSLREARGYTQTELQDLVAPHLRSKFISMIEHGRQIVMSEDIEAFAKALHVDPHDFARKLLQFHNPLVYNLIFDEN